jgi:hypothetical protein
MFKDNLSFIYITMDALRIEVEQEIKRTRLDKNRLYDLLLKIIDNMGASANGAQGPPGPPGPQGVPGPQGGRGLAGECKCKCTATEAAPAKAPAKTTTTTTKKAPAKKKVVAA